MEEQTQVDEQSTPGADEPSLPREPTKPPKRTRRQAWVRFLKILGGIFLALLLCFCVLIAIAVWYENRWPKPDGDLDAWDFGKNGAKGVTVPFTFTGGMIRVQGFIGTHPTRFLVDTGNYASNIPKRLHLGTQYANDSTSFDANNTTISNHPVFVPNVRIGGITILNFSAQVPGRYVTSNRSLSGAVADECILGNSALSHVVVTINYARRLITFQLPGNQPTLHGPKPGTAYQYTWLEGDTPNGNYAPILKGESYHHHLNVLFDTGTANWYLISPQLEEDLVKNKKVSLTRRKVKTKTANGCLVSTLTTPMVLTLPTTNTNRAITLRLYALSAPVCSNPAYAVIGGIIFRQYVVTIDYPHRTITFTLPKRG